MEQANFHPLATRELNDAAAYYEFQNRGLGLDFLAAVEHTIDRLLRFPKSGRLLRGTVRRALLRGFPYALLYRERADGIRILAVMHTRRRPWYWTRRR
ncbi:MAG: type II toxin-antitoxin system RelE/ParE family toxin [Candidatus Schekmanbacteria bacterium]|nr:type II toxin-antitoxin system RelE/ParE family toxin [Candidatus Schekmanbacteria bacterium]